jgi:SAM-dependent methyltransferase
MLNKVLNSTLKHPGNYILLQKLLGADRLRDKCVAIADLKPEDSVLDIGCGPANLLEAFPTIKHYYGIDTEKRYIDYAVKKYRDRGQFYCGEFNETFLASAAMKPVDKVFLMGILHHISDEMADDLLRLIYKVLKPGGLIVTLDPCFVPNQSIISKLVAKNDRGRFVRNEVGYRDLMKRQFSTISASIHPNTCRIPSIEIIMTAIK